MTEAHPPTAASIRGSCIRVTPHLHIPFDAMDRLIEALQTIAV